MRKGSWARDRGNVKDPTLKTRGLGTRDRLRVYVRATRLEGHQSGWYAPILGYSPMPHDDFWSAIHKRVAAAEFFLNEMSKDILPPWESAPHQPILSALRATGVALSHPWQERFYPHFDAFLAMTRSVPEIIRSLFGTDPFPALKSWRARLDPAELARRKAFQSQFDAGYGNFKKMALSGARNVTLHRTGVAPVEARVTGRWGTVYVGTPLQQIPLTESLPISSGNDPALQWLATQPPPQIELRPTDFSLVVTGGGPASNLALFPECQRFLEAARKLVVDAQRISQATHGSAPLTTPPL